MPRLNFTGRRRISHSHVQISVTGIGGIETFHARLELASYKFPPTARVVIEAYRQLELSRFEFGTVEQIDVPSNCRLSEFGSLSGLRFRVKIVSTDVPRGRLLGVADRIHPQDSHRESLLRVPLLPVKSQDLGREVWRLDFSDEPLLLVNSRLVSRKALVQTSEFQSMVLPEILRSILNRIVLVDQVRSGDDNDDWSARWLNFAASLPGSGVLPEQADMELDHDWIDMAVGSFCRWRGVDRQFVSFWQNRVTEMAASADDSSESTSESPETSGVQADW
ncbi:MAG: hypothetical protein KDA91_00500 [Planctomycetaceae bacterium]|nr:hypothetical protein [Planctomycetaceae bacterium]